ncbi:MAG: flagellar protein FlgN [Alphaproteobacteria bacterium]|jgi:hypothetical protein|nr:flagellar protein FlgN [Alphaproteobacteria bacterium]MDP7223049.1 flagellar protein FlgN [Alphaproteobacteria bacterium]
MTTEQYTTHNASNAHGAPSPQNTADKPEALVLARDPKKAMKQMLETIGNLSALYEEENDALAKANTQKFLSLQDEKIKIARNYQNGMRQILDRKDEFKDFSEEFKAKLIAKQKAFDEIARQNLTAIERTQKSVTRLNERIMETAREKASKKNVNYKDNGRLGRNERPVSMGLSESV